MRALAIVAATSMMTFAAQAQETEIPLSDVPEVVMDAAHLAAEGVTFKTVAVEDMGGQNKYGFSGIEGKDAGGQDVDIEISWDGSEITIETGG